jgi:hypothetical protein
MRFRLLRREVIYGILSSISSDTQYEWLDAPILATGNVNVNLPGRLFPNGGEWGKGGAGALIDEA